MRQFGIICLVATIFASATYAAPPDKIEFMFFAETREISVREENADHFHHMVAGYAASKISLEKVDGPKDTIVYKMTTQLLFNMIEGKVQTDKAKPMFNPRIYRCTLDAEGVFQEVDDFDPKKKNIESGRIFATTIFRTKDDKPDKKKIDHTLGTLEVHRAHIKNPPKGLVDTNQEIKRTKWYSPKLKLNLWSEAEELWEDGTGLILRRRYRAEIPYSTIKKWFAEPGKAPTQTATK
jgi:hypothetical protein